MKGSNSSQSFGARQGGGGSRLAGAAVTKWLLIVLLGFFLVDVMGRGSSVGRLAAYFLLDGGVTHEIWRWLLYPLVNLNIGNWFFSLISLFVFGSLTEKGLGSYRFGMMLLFTVLVGAVVYVVVSAVSDVASLPLSGGSGIVMSLLVALAMLYPDQPVQLLIPPIPLKVKYLVMGCIVLMVVLPIIYRTGPAEALANLSSIGVGYLCMKNLHWLDLGRQKTKQGGEGRVGKKGTRKIKSKGGRMKARTVLNMSVSKRETEVNRILDKVSAEGIGNLSEDEREILKFASKK